MNIMGGSVKNEWGIIKNFFVLWLTYATAGEATFLNWLDLLPHTNCYFTLTSTWLLESITS